ncbi:MAG: type II secretion system F family protein [Acidimicrobiales bacterium]
MTVLNDPIVGFAVFGVVAGVAVIVLTMLRMGGARPSRTAYTSATRPDRRVKRLDDAVAAMPALRRAVEVTADLASRRGFLGAAERSLRAADVPVRPAEFILAHGTATVVLPLVTFLVTQSTTSAGLVFAALLATPLLGLRTVVARRQKRFAAQLPDALTSLAGSLRAGRSLAQGIEALSRELPDPMGRELRKVVAEVRLGSTLQEALADASKRIASADFRWAVLAVQIQSEVGGNLAELLDQVATTMRERARMKGEVKALTAEGRASAMMLVIMVPGLGLAMWALNPSYMEPLFSTGTGKVLIGISTVMISGGYAWMNSMVKIDV